ncbi:MAG: hypothetical protein MUC50_06970 [Myxococcota bacterium]|nr:hypothetical protein [Myxococcota bacterium]
MQKLDGHWFAKLDQLTAVDSAHGALGKALNDAITLAQNNAYPRILSLDCCIDHLPAEGRHGMSCCRQNVLFAGFDFPVSSGERIASLIERAVLFAFFSQF